ncbi:MAG TPA: type II toxin-antitoxin system VapC family toxin [Azospirillum sp.]
MRVLLDTHALVWWLAGNPSLPASARAVIADGGITVFVSAATAWEIATKHRIGKLPAVESVVADVEGYIAAQGFVPLPVTMRHGQAAGALPGPHRDPFDRMLIAQAIIEDMALVSNERLFDAYGVRRLW